MRVEYKNFKASPQSPQLELMSAYTSLGGADSRPHLFGYTPVARMNPYQGLLYSSFPSNMIAVAPILRPSGFRELSSFTGMGSTTSLHLHWNSWMTAGQTTEERARAIGVGMATRLSRLRDKGINVVWTVHNIYPHDAQYLDVELEIQQIIADSANIIHVMSQSSVDSMAEYTKIDESKLVLSPHPSYQGAYPNFVSREEARMMLGIGPDEIVFLLFGAIKAYKGLPRHLDSLDLLCAKYPETRIRLLIAGGADDSPEVQMFLRDAYLHPQVLIEPTRITSDRAQYFIKASDIGLVNYERSLNSGAALLYGTFGLPVVAADTPSFREGLDPASTSFVLDGSADAFADAMGRAIGFLGNQNIYASLANHIANLDPCMVSDDFAKQIIARLE